MAITNIYKQHASEGYKKALDFSRKGRLQSRVDEVADTLDLDENDPRRKTIKKVVSRYDNRSINAALKNVHPDMPKRYQVKRFTQNVRQARRTP